MKPTTIEPNTLGKKHLTQPFYETTKERTMNTIKLISAIVAGLTFGVSQAANATDWADFSQSNTFVEVTSTDGLDATALRTVTVVCPVKGYLIAQAESVFNLTQSSFFFRPWLVQIRPHAGFGRPVCGRP